MCIFLEILSFLPADKGTVPFKEIREPSFCLLFQNEGDSFNLETHPVGSIIGY